MVLWHQQQLENFYSSQVHHLSREHILLERANQGASDTETKLYWTAVHERGNPVWRGHIDDYIG